jgi:uncharacterized protein (DUF58 family)
MRQSTAVALLGAGALTAATLFATRPLVPVGLGLLVAGLAARIWAEVVGRRVRVTRTVPLERPLEGGTVRIVYRLEGVQPYAVGRSRARERLEGLGELEARLSAGQGAVELRRAPRGRFAVGAAEVVVDDHLGLETVVVSPDSVQPLLVYPRIPDLDGLFTDAARHVGGSRYRPVGAGGFDFHAVREYEQGESLRKVHWPTTARLGRLMVRELREAPHDDVLVLLQCDGAAVVGPRGDSSFDAQVRAAGGLLRALVGRGRKAALVLGARKTELVRVTSLDSDWDSALAALAAVEPDGDLPLERLLEDPAVERTGELLVVAATLGARAVERLLLTGRRRTAVVLVETASFGRGAVASAPSPELLRLAAAGIAVAVVRRGDDLTRVLGAATHGRASA